jgi:hypothetical protein
VNSTARAFGLYIYESLTVNTTVLCIHRDPLPLTVLSDNGYGVVTASSGLRLLMTQPVHAVVLEYYRGLLDGAIVADEIKQVRPHLPVVMVADPIASRGFKVGGYSGG